MSSISIFHTGFVICLAGAILFFVITVVLFFIFDIRTIFAIRTGRAQAKTVKEMEMVNNSTGRLRSGKNNRQNSSQGKKSGKLERRGPVIQPPPAAAPPAYQPPQAGAPAGYQPQPASAPVSYPQPNGYADYEENTTEQLGSGDRQGADETSVLGYSEETAVLGGTAAPDSAETAVLTGVPAASAPVQQSAAPVYFEVVKKILCHDTDEVIS